MNRFWRFTLAAGLTCGILVGCGKVQNDDNLPTNSGNASQEQDQELQKSAYAPGERTETEYASEWIGLRYTLSGDMFMATDEEINSMMELGADEFDQGNLLADYAKITTVYEMMAINALDQSNIIICAEKLPFSAMSEEQYLSSVKKQVEQIYTDDSITYSDGGQRDLGGLTFQEMGYLVEHEGTALYQTYLVRKQDDRMYGIVLSYSEEAMLDVLLGGFAAF